MEPELAPDEDASVKQEAIENFIDPNWRREDIPALHVTERLARHHRALRQLTGRSEARMHLRLAVLHTFRDAGPFLDPSDLERELAWIREERRQSTIVLLGTSGWLMRLDAGAYCLTREARQLVRVLWTFLNSISPAEVGTGVSPGTEADDLAWALDHGADPTPALENLRLELLTVSRIIEDGLASGSHRRLESVKDEARNLIEDIGRTHLLLQQCREQEKVTIRDSQEIYGLLSRVFSLHAELERRLAKESRNLISTRPGFTPQRIFSIFLAKTTDELVEIGERYLVAPHIPPVFVNADRFKGEAARYFSEPPLQKLEASWEEPLAIAAGTIPQGPTIRATPELERLAEDLRTLAEHEGIADAREFLPTTEAGESLMRVAVVAMLSSDPKARTQIVPDLDVKLEIEKEPGGSARPVQVVSPGRAINAMTPGRVLARKIG